MWYIKDEFGRYFKGFSQIGIFVMPQFTGRDKAKSYPTKAKAEAEARQHHKVKVVKE